jgi:tetratricopeptide (TPR) repeat protein
MICARLDGIPLAIELAAARVGSLPAEAIAARLDQSIRLLTGGPRDVLPRHQTLRAALDWSWDLLSAAERMLLRRLAVFAGGWTLDAAETVCAGDGIEDWQTLDLLDGLLHKSLAHLDGPEDAARYGLLETVRQYAEDRLLSAGEQALLSQRHATYYLALAEKAEPALTGPDQVAWLARLALEHNNLRATLHWAGQEQQVEIGLRLAGALWRFWYVRGFASEGRRWLEDLLAQQERTHGPFSASVPAKAYAGAGVLASIQSDYGRATALLESSLRLRRELGDKRGIAASLSSLATVAYHQGNYEHAIPMYTESLSLYRELGDKEGISRTLNNLGALAEMQGSYQEAATLYQESLVLSIELGGQQDRANALFNLGSVLARLADHARAIPLLEESHTRYQALGDKEGMVFALQRLGEEATRAGEPRLAGLYHRRSLTLAQELGQRVFIACNLEGLAAVAMVWWRLQIAGGTGPPTECKGGLAAAHRPSDERAWPVRAARLLGAAAALRVLISAPVVLAEQPFHEGLFQEVQTALGAAVFASTWEAGQILSLDEAIDQALQDEAD